VRREKRVRRGGVRRGGAHGGCVCPVMGVSFWELGAAGACK
jgi:hypothetical protein